jgi:hypothetical protein
MPAGLNEAYKTPFSKSNPGNQYYDLSSFTRSSHSDSIRNEYFDAEMSDAVRNYNRTYTTPHGQLGGSGTSNISQTKSSQSSLHNQTQPHPSSLYPPLKLGTEINTVPNYLSEPEPQVSMVSKSNNLISDSDCEDLIYRVLSNQKCRRLLKKIFEAEKSSQSGGGSNRSEMFPCENFPSVFGLSNETVRNLVVYGGGLLLFLCALDMLSRLSKVRIGLTFPQ